MQLADAARGMIVDAHHHVISAMDCRDAARDAAYRFNTYGGGARSQRLSFTIAQIERTIEESCPDPGCAKLLERMTRAGIDVTIMCTVDNVSEGDSDEACMAKNRALAETAALSRGRIVSVAGVDPRRNAAPAMLRRCIEELGMRGLKWMPPNGYYPNSKCAYAVLAVAEQLGIPLITHTGPLPPAAKSLRGRWAKYAQLVFLDEVLQDFPDLKIVAAHMGRHDWRQWASLAQFRRNLFGDLAMWQVLAVTQFERFCRDLREILDIAGADSVLFGSDGPGFTWMVPNEQFIGIIRSLTNSAPAGIRFTAGEVAGILGENARQVFGL